MSADDRVEAEKQIVLFLALSRDQFDIIPDILSQSRGEDRERRKLFQADAPPFAAAGKRTSGRILLGLDIEHEIVGFWGRCVFHSFPPS